MTKKIPLTKLLKDLKNKEIKCQNCSYKWTPRKPKPKCCPKCKIYI